MAPYEAFYAGWAIRDRHTLCPGGGAHAPLMAMIENRRVDLTSLVTHKFTGRYEKVRASAISGRCPQGGAVPEAASAWPGPVDAVGAVDEQCAEQGRAFYYKRPCGRIFVRRSSAQR